MDWACDLEAFRARLAASTTYGRCSGVLADALGALGLDDFNYGAPSISSSVLSSMDPKWIAKYVADGYFRSDKLVLAAAERTSPFRSDEIFTAPPRTVREAEMEAAIADHPLGIVVPLHCPVVGFAVLAAFSPLRGAAFDRQDGAVRATLTLIAHEFHDHALGFYASLPRNDGSDHLSPREREALRWAAAGKTASEIGDLLALSPNTINNHLAAARRKLGVASTAAAIAMVVAAERGSGRSRIG